MLNLLKQGLVETVYFWLKVIQICIAVAVLTFVLFNI